MSEALIAAASVAVTLAAVFLSRYLKDRQEKSRKLASSMEEVIAAMMGDDFQNAMKALPELAKGMTLMAKAQADTMDRMEKGVDLLRQSMDPNRDSDRYEEYSTETARARRDAEDLEIRELMRRDQGISREQAQERIRERNIYEQLARGR